VDNRIYVSVDVEANAPAPGLGPGWGMTEVGAVVVTEQKPISSFWGVIEGMSTTFYGGGSYNMNSVPLTQTTDIKVWKIEGSLLEVMSAFDSWLASEAPHPIFLSDNNGFDWQFVNHAFWLTLGNNPFGHSSRRISDLYSGVVRNLRKGTGWKKYRKAAHTHNPLQDALGNAQAFLEILRRYKVEGL